MQKKQLFIVATLLLIFCVHPLFSSGVNEADQGTTSIEYWSAAWHTFYEVGKDSAEKYMEENPDVEIVVTAAAREEEILMSAVAGGVAPDLYGQFSSERVPQYLKYNAITPLNQLEGFQSLFEERVPEEFREEYTMENGNVYIFPYNAAPVLLIYNKKLFREAGLVDSNGEPVPPKTWAEYANYAKEMTMDSDNNGQIDSWGAWIGLGNRAPWRHLDFLPLYLSKSGGKRMYGNGGEAIFNGEDGIATMKFMLDLYKNGWTKRDPEGYSSFPNGDIGMIFGGGWLISSLPEDFDYGIAPIPVPNEGDQFYTFLDSKDIGILTQSDNKEEAFQFLKFLVSKEQDLQMFERTLQVPLREGLASDPDFTAIIESTPHVDEFLKALPYSVNLPWLENYGFYQQAFNDAYSAIIESEGGVTIETAFANAARKIAGD